MAIPGLFTGKYCESLADMSHYGQSHWMKDSFLKSYLDQNIPVYVNIALTKDGYTNRLKPMNSADMPMETAGPLKDKMYGMYPMNLIQLIKFRLSPYFLKESYVSGLSFPVNKAGAAQVDNLNRQQLRYDKLFWPILAAKPVNSNLDMTLHVHHTMGGHPPTMFTREGLPAKAGDVSYNGHVEQCVFVFRQVAKMLDVWKTNGVYDASTIFILADHSSIYVRPGHDYKGLPLPAFPFLMVKIQKNRGKMRHAAMPTSHANIAESVAHMANRPFVLELDVANKLYAKVRKCVDFSTRDESFREYMLDEDAKMESKVIETKNRHPDVLEVVRLNHEYSFLSQRGSFFAKYGLVGGTRGHGEGTAGTNMLFTILLPEKNHVYDLEFQLYPRRLHGDHAVLISSDGVVRCERTHAYLSGVRSDGEGLVRVQFEKVAEDEGGFAVQTMTVREHVGEAKVKADLLWSGNVEIAANNMNFNFKKIPKSLVAGHTYHLSADQLDVTSGVGNWLSVVLYNFKTNRAEDKKTFKIDLSNSHALWNWKFKVPNGVGDYACLVYAGEVGKTAGMGIRLRNVKLEQLDD